MRHTHVANISRRPAPRVAHLHTPAGFETHLDRVLGAHNRQELPAVSATETETLAVGPRFTGNRRRSDLAYLAALGEVCETVRAGEGAGS